MQRFWIHRRQADIELKSNGKVEDIKKHLNVAAAALGRPVPTGSRLELWASAVWQVTHQFLHRFTKIPMSYEPAHKLTLLFSVAA